MKLRTRLSSTDAAFDKQLAAAAAAAASGQLDEAIARLTVLLDETSDDASLARVSADLGRAFFQRGRVWEARKAYARSVQLAPNEARVWQEYGECLDELSDNEGARRAYREAIDLCPDSRDARLRLAVNLQRAGRALEASAVLYPKEGTDNQAETWLRVGLLFGRNGYWQEAVQAWRLAVEADPEAPEPRRRLASGHAQLHQWPQVVACLDEAVHLGPSAGDYYARGFAREKMGELAGAAQDYRTAIAFIDSPPNRWHFRLGWVLRQLGDVHAAAMAFQRSRAPHHATRSRTPARSRVKYTIVRWLEALCLALYRVGVRRLAVFAIRLTLRRLEYKFDRLYRWAAWLERAGDVDGASHAFRRCFLKCTSGPGHRKRDERYFARELARLAVPSDRPPALERQARLAYCVDRLGLDHEAVASVPTSALEPVSYTDVGHVLVARVLVHRGEQESAVHHYRLAVERQATFSGQWWFELGHLLAGLGRYEDAVEYLARSRRYRQPSLHREGVVARSGQAKRLSRYLEFLETEPLRRDVILYEADHGARLSCNPLAMFEQKLSEDPAREFTHVWALNDSEAIPDRFASLPNVIFVRVHSDGYLRWLASAGWLINNVSFPPYFIRREAQRYLNTWHGSPHKSLGRDMRGRHYEHANVARNLLQATHVLSQGPHMSSLMLDVHDITNLCQARLGETGYPRTDVTVRLTDSERQVLRARLGAASTDALVLYAPTFRGTVTDRDIDVDEIEAVISCIRETGAIPVVRLHRLVAEALRGSRASRYLAPDDVDTNRLLAATDALVTDYSSIWFDYLCVDRPIVYHLFDDARYTEERGTYLQPAELPGSVTRTRDELRGLLARGVSHLPAPSAFDGRLASSRDRFAPLDDGRAAERAWWFFLGDSDENDATPPTRSSPSYLLYGGPFMANGITTSLLNLTAGLAQFPEGITVAVDPRGVTHDEVRAANVAKLHQSVEILARTPGWVMSLDERHANATMERGRGYQSVELRRTSDAAYRREAVRSFGRSQGLCVVNFEGYAPWWSQLFAMVPDARSRTIYLHNDMTKEWQEKYPYLVRTISTYADYDTCVSVSESVRDRNRETLGPRFDIPARAFQWLPNVIDPEAIRRAASWDAVPKTAQTTLDNRERFEASVGARIVTVGRLSPEKDHEKLLRAIRRYLDVGGQVSLFVLGLGPLEASLRELTRELGLADSVYFLGYEPHPFPFMSSADLFILSSNHEGQPMVLLEALALGQRVLATDIPGVRDVLAGGRGTLVENSVDGLVEGLVRVLDHHVMNEPFDADVYRLEALDQFRSMVLNERARADASDAEPRTDHGFIAVDVSPG